MEMVRREKGLKEDRSVCGCSGQGGYRQLEPPLGIGSALRSLVEGRGHGYTALAAPYHQARRSPLQHKHCRRAHTRKGLQGLGH
jgi:hypothetical protein